MRTINQVLSVAILFSMSVGVQAVEKIVLSNGATFPPMHTGDGTGFVDLVLAEAFRRLGIDLEIVSLPNERSLLNSNNGIIDGESQRIEGMDKNYPNLIMVPEKIMDWQFVGFAKKTIAMTQGWDSLAPHTTAYIIGWKIFEYNVPKNVAVTSVKHPRGLFVLLNNDRADIALYELWQGLEWIERGGFSQIKPLSPPLAVRKMFTYLHKKHRDIVPKLATALKNMKADGSYRRIYEHVLTPLEIK